MKKTFIGSLLGALLLSWFPCHSGSAADLVDGWSVLVSGQLPKSQIFLAAGIPLTLTSFQAGGLADAGTSPANPFPGTERALYVEPGASNGQLRIRTRPFLEESPPDGSYEMTFQIVEGSFYLGVGVITSPWEAKDERSTVESERLFAVRFVPGDPLACEKQAGLATESVSALATGENYTFRLDWKTVGETMEFRLFLNDKPLLASNGEPYISPVQRSKLSAGVPGFLLSSGSSDSPCAKMFIGSIRASAGGL